jgi:hypothetical protein
LNLGEIRFSLLEQCSRKFEIMFSGFEGGLRLVDDASVFPLFVLPLSTFET